MGTRTSLSLKKTKSVALGAAFVCFALALSFLETLIPTEIFIPIPGFKLGLANIVICVVFYRESPGMAAAVSACRLCLTLILFSNVSAFLFSLSGAALSYASLFLSKYILKDKISFIGVSVISAFFHNAGQLMCASIVMGSLSVFYYAPYLIFVSAVCGGITGVILTILPRKIFFEKESLKSL